MLDLKLLQGARGARRPERTLSGSWVTDLAELRKCITLCPSCQNKFGAKKYRYHRVERYPLALGAHGQCDGCRNPALCRVFMPDEHQHY